MNASFVILGTICCPTWESFVSEIANNGSDVAIVFIICLTVFVSLLVICSKSFAYLTKRESAIINQKTIDELRQEIADLEKERDRLLEEKNTVEKKLQLTPEKKEDNRFLDFCFEMAKSVDKDNLEMKRECWDILKERLNTSKK